MNFGRMKSSINPRFEHAHTHGTEINKSKLSPPSYHRSGQVDTIRSRSWFQQLVLPPTSSINSGLLCCSAILKWYSSSASYNYRLISDVGLMCPLDIFCSCYALPIAINRGNKMKINSVTISDRFSVTEHISTVICSYKHLLLAHTSSLTFLHGHLCNCPAPATAA